MPLSIRLARWLGIVDHPTHRKIHSKPTPYLGGLGILAAFVFVPGICFYCFNEFALTLDVVRFSVVVAPLFWLRCWGCGMMRGRFVRSTNCSFKWRWCLGTLISATVLNS